MALYTHKQDSFLAGEVSSLLESRSDFARRNFGLKEITNALVTPYGQIVKRPGMRFIATAPGNSLLFTFVISREEQYVLAFSPNQVDIFLDGSRLKSESISTPYAEDELKSDPADDSKPGLKFAPRDNLLYITHPSHGVHVLERLADGGFSLSEVESNKSVTVSKLAAKSPIETPDVASSSGIWTEFGSTRNVTNYHTNGALLFNDGYLYVQVNRVGGQPDFIDRTKLEKVDWSDYFYIAHHGAQGRGSIPRGGGVGVPNTTTAGLAIDSSGKVYVAKAGFQDSDFGIYSFTVGETVWTKIELPSGAMKVSGVLGGMAIDSSDNILLATRSPKKLWTRKGGTWDAGVDFPAKFGTPSDIAIKSDGKIYVAEALISGGIWRYDGSKWSDAPVVKYPNASLAGATVAGLAIGPAGEFYIYSGRKKLILTTPAELADDKGGIEEDYDTIRYGVSKVSSRDGEGKVVETSVSIVNPLHFTTLSGTAPNFNASSLIPGGEFTRIRIKGDDARYFLRSATVSDAGIITVKIGPPVPSKVGSARFYPQGGEGFFPEEGVALTWEDDDPGEVETYRIYKRRGLHGSLGFIGETSETSFIDTNIEPNYLASPPVLIDYLDENPGTMAWFEGRAVFSGFEINRRAIVASSPGGKFRFETSRPVRDSDSVYRELDASVGGGIRHLHVQGVLLPLLAGEGWIMSGGEKNFSPSSVFAQKAGGIGSSHIPPVSIRDSFIFVGYDRKTIWLGRPGGSSRTNTIDYLEMTLLVREQIKLRSIVDIALAPLTNQLFVVFDDGTFGVMLVLLDEDVFAWSEHYTPLGEVQSVAVADGAKGGESAYFVVERGEDFQVEVMRLREASYDSDAFSIIEDLPYLDNSVVIDTGGDTTTGGVRGTVDDTTTGGVRGTVDDTDTTIKLVPIPLGGDIRAIKGPFPLTGFYRTRLEGIPVNVIWQSKELAGQAVTESLGVGAIASVAIPTAPGGVYLGRNVGISIEGPQPGRFKAAYLVDEEDTLSSSFTSLPPTALVATSFSQVKRPKKIRTPNPYYIGMIVNTDGTAKIVSGLFDTVFTFSNNPLNLNTKYAYHHPNLAQIFDSNIFEVKSVSAIKTVSGALALKYRIYTVQFSLPEGTTSLTSSHTLVGGASTGLQEPPRVKLRKPPVSDEALVQLLPETVAPPLPVNGSSFSLSKLTRINVEEFRVSVLRLASRQMPDIFNGSIGEILKIQSTDASGGEFEGRMIGDIFDVNGLRQDILIVSIPDPLDIKDPAPTADGTPEVDRNASSYAVVKRRPASFAQPVYFVGVTIKGDGTGFGIIEERYSKVKLNTIYDLHGSLLSFWFVDPLPFEFLSASPVKQHPSTGFRYRIYTMQFQTEGNSAFSDGTFNEFPDGFKFRGTFAYPRITQVKHGDRVQSVRSEASPCEAPVTLGDGGKLREVSAGNGFVTIGTRYLSRIETFPIVPNSDEVLYWNSKSTVRLFLEGRGFFEGAFLGVSGDPILDRISENGEILSSTTLREMKRKRGIVFQHYCQSFFAILSLGAIIDVTDQKIDPPSED